VTSVFPFAETVPLGDEAYYLLNEFLEGRLGLHFPEHRRRILENRLQPRLRALSLDDFMDYYVLLEADADGELDLLSQAVTNNETYLFREREQLDVLFGEGLDVLRSGLAVPGHLRILSAGCSSGEEAYTLNFYARERSQGLEVNVDAFDLDTQRLAIAKRAECRTRSLREMTADQTAKYLDTLDDDRYAVKPFYRRGVRFFHGNIIDRWTFRPAVPFDAVFCRNVLIYFSEASMRKAVRNFVDVLRPGGFLFLGHSESVIGMFPDLETIRLGRSIVYRKVG
jgi:chemotaxis protein methyltransferase CheR